MVLRLRGDVVRAWLRGLTAEQMIKGGTGAVVLAVAAFAAVVSYSHIYDLAREHGQAGAAARLLPLSVDGLILAASLVMLHAARTAGLVWLARCMLGLGVAATVGANVFYGLAFGMLGAVISAWPAVAFIGAAEMALGMVRSASKAPVPEPGALHPLALSNGHAAPEGGQEAARIFADELSRRELPSVRRVQREMHLGQPRAREVRAYLDLLCRG
jgi:Protein of unknown function (DUF2637)